MGFLKRNYEFCMEKELLYFGYLALSAFLGGAIGWQRERIGKSAGPRTFALICMTATLLMLLSVHGFGDSADPARLAAQIIMGIGFIGGGTILRKRSGVEGLTTAAGMWSVTGVGMAIGVGWLFEAFFTAAIIFVILALDDKGRVRL